MNQNDTLQHYTVSERTFVKQCLSLKRDVLQNGRLKVTNFLTIREQEILGAVIGTDLTLVFDGGFEQSERKLAIMSDHVVSRDKGQVVILLIQYNKKFGTLRHQDILGAILGLGLDRKAIGDIVFNSEGVFVAIRQNIAQYLLTELRQIGRQTVQVGIYTERVIKEKERFKEKTIYVNSLRLDSLVSHILACNRVRAKELITKGLVQINGVAVLAYKIGYTANDIISIRKFGRIYIDDILKTRRERFKVAVRIT